jgi:hypothetical protein
MSNRERTYLAMATAGIVSISLWGALECRHLASTRLSQTRADYQQRLLRIRLDDGVDSSEAAEIAQIYMSVYMSEQVGRCGAVEPPVLRDGTWTTQVRVGYAGRPSDTIEVDAKTGAVSSSSGPVFGTFRGFADAIVTGKGARRR